MSSITGLSSFLPTNTGYDFTKMTSRQAIAAAGDLEQKGIITPAQCAILMGETPALAYTPVAGWQPGDPDPMDSPEVSDYFQLTKNAITNLESTAGSDADMQKSLTSTNALLQALTKYQSQENNGAVSGSLFDSRA